MLRTTLNSDDISTIRSLVAEASVFSAEEIEIAAELVAEALDKGAERSGYDFILLEDDKTKALLGYACYGRIPFTQSSFDLYWIVVDPNQQRKGYAKLLLESVDEALKQKKASQLYAETSGQESYGSARKFYLNNGFEQIVSFKDFYKPGDDKIVFRRDYSLFK